MSTASIDAGVIRDAAIRVVSSIDTDRASRKAIRVSEILKEPVVTGPFWRKTIHRRTPDEAAARYDDLLEHRHTPDWWDDLGNGERRDRAIRIRDLAATAIRDGRCVVVIDHHEATFLKLPRTEFAS